MYILISLLVLCVFSDLFLRTGQSLAGLDGGDVDLAVLLSRILLWVNSVLLLSHLIVLLANVDVFLNSEISAFDIEGILGIYWDWIQELEFCLLSLVAVVHVQESLPNVYVIFLVPQWM